MTHLLLVFVLAIQNVSQNLAESDPQNERVITDLELLFGNQGAPVKYSYNETTSNNGTTSVPGCPQSIEGIPWIYYGDPPRCFLAGHYGPCPLAEKLLAMQSSPFGICACECIVDKIQETSGFMLQQEASKQRYIFCEYQRTHEFTKTGQVYDSKESICYETHTQGPCNDGEVLVGVDSDSEDKPKCLTSCKLEDGSLGYLKGKSCYSFSTNYAATRSVKGNDCSANEKYSKTLQKCIKTKKFALF